MKILIDQQFDDFLKRFGIDVPKVLFDIGVKRPWRGELTLDAIEYYNFISKLDGLLSDEAILQLSNVANLQTFMPQVFAALCSSDGRRAIEVFSKFKKLIGPIEFNVIETPSSMVVEFEYSHKARPLPRFSVLNEQAIVVSLLRLGTGKEIKPILVESPYFYSKPVVDFFGIKPRLSSTNRIVFGADDLGEKFISENNTMYKYLEPELSKQLSEINNHNSITWHIQRKLIEAIPSGSFSADVIAKSLGMSARTLQRNLSSEGTTFKEQLQNIQKSMAVGYFNMNITNDEIAFLLGYSETSAFLRAFKSWTGETVGEFKAKNNPL